MKNVPGSVLQYHIHALGIECKLFALLLSRAETAKELIQKVFGIKFHKAYPNQVKTECDDNCGGCGIYPNIMRGRRGVQLLAEQGRPVCE